MDFYLGLAVVGGFVILGAQWLEDWQQRRRALVLQRGRDH